MSGRAATLLALGLACLPRLAVADDEAAPEVKAPAPKLDLGLTIEPDLRFRLEDKVAGSGFYDTLRLPAGVERASSLLKGKLKGKLGDLTAVGQVDVLLSGLNGRIDGLADFSDPLATQPVQVSLQSLYVEARGFLVDGLDLRLGQQVVSWGVGDQFNPTNNLSQDDLRDPLLFGRQAGNFMVTADFWAPADVQLEAVLVPIFRPALLPFTAPLGLSSLDRMPFVDEKLRNRVEAEMSASRSLGFPTVLGHVTTELPDLSAGNLQVGVKAATSLGGLDVSVSYYRGRTDFPVPIANHTRQVAGARCDPAAPAQCIAGTLETDVTLAFPRMQVVGLNLAGELLSFGFRVEGAVIFPERTDLTLTNTLIDLGSISQPAGEYDYDGDGAPGGPRPAVVDSTPFAKWAVGIDRAVGKHLYLNGQWVHGMVDEFGAGDWLHGGEAVRSSGVSTSVAQTLVGCAQAHDGTTCAVEEVRPRLGDYAVLGADLKLMNEALLLRLFTIIDLSGSTTVSYDDNRMERARESHSFLSSKGFSALAYPEIRYRLETGFTVSAGALLMLGKATTKFGEAAAGGSLAWLRLTYAL
jgi:hypothetical protein